MKPRAVLIALLAITVAVVCPITADPPSPGTAVDAPAFAGCTCLGKNEQQQFEYRHEATGMVFVLIPAGEFWMGSPEDEPYRNADERRHRVRITKPYLMGKTEVTNAQYRRVKPQHDSGNWDGKDLNGESQPVVEVSWLDATAFCEKLGFRLPTEAQWEWAARGGDEKNVFVWGRDWPPPAKAGNFADASERAFSSAKKSYDEDRAKDPSLALPASYADGFTLSSPVGSFSPNRYGLYDMAGDVWEWCRDWCGEYSDSSTDIVVDPTGPSTGERRVVRGGSWGNFRRGYLRCAERNGGAPDDQYTIDRGFRVVIAVGSK